MTQACEAKVRAAEDGHARVVQQSPKAGCRCEVSLMGLSSLQKWQREDFLGHGPGEPKRHRLPTLAGKGSAQSSV
jgi:hypothetical protein